MRKGRLSPVGSSRSEAAVLEEELEQEEVRRQRLGELEEGGGSTWGARGGKQSCRKEPELEEGNRQRTVGSSMRKAAALGEEPELEEGRWRHSGRSLSWRAGAWGARS